MNTPSRLSLYGLGLVAAFGAAFVVSGAVVPETAVDARSASQGGDDPHAGMAGMASPEGSGAAPSGVSLAVDDYRLGPISAPDAIGPDGLLRFSVLDAEGEPLREYAVEQEKELHLIVVRSDGSEFRHVHPEIDGSGEWSIPWSWDAAGSYRVFADFTPGSAESGITLTRTISVAGDFDPVEVGDEVRDARAGEFDVALSGDLTAGGSSNLTVAVTRDGEPVTVQPYLGAFGHLVALRDGDLAYLHAHPDGTAPEAGQASGPDIEFATEVPTPGRYLLYFDFQVDGEVQSASFVLTTTDEGAGSGGDGSPVDQSESNSRTPSDNGDDDR